MTIGRPVEYDPDFVLDAAMHLFWGQGYAATSMQDLMKSMQLSKSSLYQAFGSKHLLFLRCLERYHAMTMADMRESLENSETGLGFILETLSKVIADGSEDGNPRGCLVTNTATEFGQSDPRIAAGVTKGLEGYLGMFRAAVIMGQADGSIREDWDPKVASQYLLTNMSGLRTMVKAGTKASVLDKMVAVIVSTLE